MLKFNIISVDTPTIEPSNNKTYLIGGQTGHAVTLTCKTDYDDMDTTSYLWKLNNSTLYVYRKKLCYQYNFLYMMFKQDL